jgi:hypothetical protein
MENPLERRKDRDFSVEPGVVGPVRNNYRLKKTVSENNQSNQYDTTRDGSDPSPTFKEDRFEEFLD